MLCNGRNALLVALLLAGAAGARDNLLVNPGFEDIDPNAFAGSGSPYGDGWGSFGNADFNAFFGPDAHASLFADIFTNSGGVFQVGIDGAEGTAYQLDLLNVRIEQNWNADLLFGFEYYGPGGDLDLRGVDLMQIDAADRLAAGSIDGNSFAMRSTAVPGTVVVRPVVRFENVDPNYFQAPQANAFVFDSFVSVAPGDDDEHLKNPGFEDVTGDGTPGDHWASFGAAGFHAFFGADAHASLFADTIGNFGGFYQAAVLGSAGEQFTFTLENVRIEENFDADLRFGLEYYGVDDRVLISQEIVPVDTSVTGDGLRFAMSGTAPLDTYYVRPIVLFDNVGSTGGGQRNAFVFAATLTRGAVLSGDVDGDCDVDLDDLLVVLGAFGTTPAGDADGDGDTDLDDLLLVLGGFGSSCP